MQTVLHVITKFAREAWAGAEQSIVEVSKRLPQHHFKSEVYSTLAFTDVERENIGGASVRRFWGFYLQPGRLWPMRRSEGQTTSAALSPRLLWTLARRSDVALVHLHCHERLTTSVAHVCWRRRIPFVYTIHSLFDPGGHTPPLGLSSLSYEWGVRRANRILAVSPREVRTLRDSYPERADDVLWMPLGVDVAMFGSGDGPGFRREYDIPSGARLMVHVGRLYGVKNQMYSVRLLGELVKRGRDVVLALVGPVFDDAYAAAVRTEIDTLKLRKHVRIIGGLTPDDRRLPAAYNAADVVLVPSKDEAQPLVIFEAFAAGAPVLVSDIENLRGVVVPGQTGEFLPLDWSLEQAATTAERMMTNRSVYTEGVRKKAEAHNWDATTKRLADCYTDVLARNGALR